MFRLETTKPPAAESGRKYQTVDERCLACEVYGGDERMCIPANISRNIQLQFGRPCPRVDLEPGNLAGFHVLQFLIHDDLKPLAVPAFQASAPGDEEGQQLLLYRIARTLQDKNVMDILHPPLNGRRED